MQSLNQFGSQVNLKASLRQRRSLVVKAEQATTSTNKLAYTGPEPRRFAVAEGQLNNVATAAFPAIIRAASGGFCVGYKSSITKADGTYAVTTLPFNMAVKETSNITTLPRPSQMLEFYDEFGSAESRKVREAITILDLNVMVYPCPLEGPTFRPIAIELSPSASNSSTPNNKKSQLPVLRDPNTGVVLASDGDAIVEYLFEKYGGGKDNVPKMLSKGMLNSVTASIAVNIRSLGKKYRPSKSSSSSGQQQIKPLEVWVYELSPFSIIVKERLSELEIPYVQRSCGRGSPQRQELFERRGTFQAPYIEDPNTGVAMFESKDIIEYLEKTYGA